MLHTKEQLLLSSRMYHNSMLFHSIHYISGSCNANLMENGLLSKCPSLIGIINENRWIWDGITVYCAIKADALFRAFFLYLASVLGKVTFKSNAFQYVTP